MLTLKLSAEETRETQHTHKFILTHEDLTEATDNTAQTIALLTLAAGQAVNFCATKLVTPFENSADAAHNTTTLIVGDAGSTNRFLASQELNENGTEVLFQAGTGTQRAYATSTAVNAVFGSQTSKNLAALDTGEVHIFLSVYDLNKI
jgi:hypothetical protein